MAACLGCAQGQPAKQHRRTSTRRPTARACITQQHAQQQPHANADAAASPCMRARRCRCQQGVKLLLPTDVVIADKFDPEANSKVVSADAIPDGWMVSSSITRTASSRDQQAQQQGQRQQGRLQERPGRPCLKQGPQRLAAHAAPAPRAAPHAVGTPARRRGLRPSPTHPASTATRRSPPTPPPPPPPLPRHVGPGHWPRLHQDLPGRAEGVQDGRVERPHGRV